MKTIELKPYDRPLPGFDSPWWVTRAEDIPAAKAVRRSLDRVERLLHHRGWKEVGAGMFGRVFAHDQKDHVLKVSKNPFESDAWFDYAQWVQRQPQSPALPRIGSLLEMKSGPYRGFLAQIEKLEPVNVNDAAQDNELSNIRDASYAAFRKVSGHAKPAHYERAAFNRLNLPLKKALVRLTKDLTINTDWSFDLHSNNIMRRPGTSQLVLTDPIC